MSWTILTSCNFGIAASARGRYGGFPDFHSERSSRNKLLALRKRLRPIVFLATPPNVGGLSNASASVGVHAALIPGEHKILSDLNGNSQRRQHFRLRFPLQERPLLYCMGREFLVTEISESGGRVLVDADRPSTFNTRAEVHINFRDDTHIVTTAVLLRFEAAEMVLRFPAAIPMKVIAAEQRRILSRYPKDVLR